MKYKPHRSQGFVNLQWLALILAPLVVYIAYMLITEIFPVMRITAQLHEPGEVTAVRLANAEHYEDLKLDHPIRPGLYRDTLEKDGVTAIEDLYLSRNGDYSISLIVTEHGALSKTSNEWIRKNGSGKWSQKGATLTFTPVADDLQGLLFSTYGVEIEPNGFSLTDGTKEGSLHFSSIGTKS